MLELEFAQVSDRGRARSGNEDYLGYAVPSAPAQAHSHGWLFALADGVGGHERGEVASRTAVEGLVAGFRAAPAGESHLALLPRLVQAANSLVYETGVNTRSAGMSTTLVAAALRYDRAVVAHVGDSRCYLIRRGRPTAITRDHTLAGEQARLGLLSAREAAEASHRHVLSRSLGSDLFVAVDSSEHQLLPGDVLVLCSDGLHGAVEADEMAHALAHAPDLAAAAAELVALANLRDGSDNISVQIVRVQRVERVGMYRGRPYKLH